MNYNVIDMNLIYCCTKLQQVWMINSIYLEIMKMANLWIFDFSVVFETSPIKSLSMNHSGKIECDRYGLNLLLYEIAARLDDK